MVNEVEVDAPPKIAGRYTWLAAKDIASLRAFLEPTYFCFLLFVGAIIPMT